jgi:drug/metabolite transporter (DMT)-like permease
MVTHPPQRQGRSFYVDREQWSGFIGHIRTRAASSYHVRRVSAVVLLSLCSALAYGLSDFVGGVLTRRASAWAVAATSQATATLLACVLAIGRAGQLDTDALIWGVVAGVGASAGNVFIYRGLAGGRMAVVAPLSAVTAAALPVLIGLATGERPGVFPTIGVLMALPAIWLVAGGGSRATHAGRADIVNGVVAGTGFGLQFSALGQIPEEAGLIPLVVSQAASVVVIVAGAIAVSAPWVPRDRFSALGTVAGLLAGTATVCFQLAAQFGLLTIAGALTSLYPAVTVLLAAVVLRERIHKTQGLGLMLAAAAVVLIVTR